MAETMNSEGIEMDIVSDGELLTWDTPEKKVVGILKSYTMKKDTGKGIGHVYEVQTKDGIIPFFAQMLLHKKLKEIAIGNIVSITYKGETKTGAGNMIKHFDVGFTKPTEANLKVLGIEMFEEAEGEKEF